MALRTKAKWTDTVTALETENKALSYQAATESIVLLENKNVLPIQVGKIALYGAGAGKTIKGGSGSGEVIERHSVSIREGLENRGFEVVTNDWLERYDELWGQEREVFIAGMRKELRKFNTEMLAEMMAAEYRYPYGDAIRADDLSDDTDYCIYVLSRQSGEGSDRRKADYMISKVERDHLEACCAHYKHVILVINTGASFDVSFVDEFENLEAVVFACQLGQEGGYALADVLTGKVNPCGRLAATWAASYKDVPFGKEYSFIGNDLNHAEYKEGIYVGYRYYDSFDVAPRYAFGYGLSYTNFAVQTTSVKVDGTKVHIGVSVKNIGDTYSGKETVQLYVSSPVGKLEKEYQSLAAFAKTDVLKPGESQELELSFSMEYIANYDEENASMILEAGDYILRVGNSSRNTEVGGVVTLSETVVVSKHRNLCVPVKPIQTLHRTMEATEVPDVEKVALDVNAFHTEVIDYAKEDEAFEPKVEAMLNKLGINDQVNFCAGIGLLGGKTEFTLPGSVGNTTSEYWKMGIPNATFCDGPAGIRIQRRSTVDKKDGVKPVDGALSIYEYLPNFLQKLLFGNPDKEQMIYQYVTSFPVATAMAQTWNLPLVEKVGQAVSKEMTEYGVVFWLAPALNIIRNPLCGRNYEYYSEDPFLSGKMAAMITRGVQQTPGNYVTIKHYATNNQEENRYYVSSDMDERTLREIYLRGFEIAVRESKPKALMTAYNKLNGIYCPANAELVDMILKKEWGFDGVVMTDWLSTGEDRAGNPESIASGVDIIMPGGKAVWKELGKAVKEGKLDRKHVRRAAGNVLKLVLNSQITTD